MTETENYKLFLNDNNRMTFLEWREQINSQNDSNMVKIDSILCGKADQSRSVPVVLSASGWNGKNAPYSQVVAVEGLTSETNGIICVAQSVTDEQMEAACGAELSVVSQSDGSITVAAGGIRPDCDIPATIILFG